MYNKKFKLFSTIKNLCCLLFLFFSANTLVAQHDLSLSLDNSTGLTQLGDTTTFNLKIENINHTDVTGIVVQVSIPETLDFVEAIAPAGTSFSETTNNWNINSQLTSNIDELDLVLKFSSTAQGTQFIQAEISIMDGFDYNSTPANGDILEDDIAVGCLAIPIELGMNDTVQLVAPIMTGGGHVWSRVTDGETTIVSTAIMYNATEIGAYRYSNDLLECNVMSCCDIVLVEENLVEICDNGLDDDNDGAVDYFDDDCPYTPPTYPCAADALEEIPISAPNLANLNNPDYTVAHILLDFEGNVVEFVDDSAQEFTGVQPGIYYTYSLSYLTNSGITGLNVSANIADISSPEIEWTAPQSLFICPATVVNDILITPCDGNFYYVVFTHLYEAGQTGTEDFNIQGQMFTETLDGSGSQQFIFQIPCGDVNLPPLANPGAIYGTIFQECNGEGSGIRDAQEEGFSNFFVSLTGTDASGELFVAFDETDATGMYAFENIPAGDYQVVINTADLGWEISPLNQGNDESIDSDINPNSGYSEIFTINGNSFIGVDAGLMDIQIPIFSELPTDTAYFCNETIPNLEPTASDNYDTDVEVTMTETQTGSECNVQIIRTWTASDDCGNISTASQTITIEDSEAPVLTSIPANTSMSCSEASNPSIPTVSDNCDTDVEISMSDIQEGSGCNYQIIRTWIATDDCGNSSTVSQNITVQDTEAPLITPVHPLLVGINSGDEITVECNTPFAMNPTDVLVTDDCDDNVTVTVEEEDIIIGNCLTNDFIILMHCYFEATDDCGNVSQFFVKIKIVDTTAPIFIDVAPNTSVSCSDNIPPVTTPTVSDNCTNSQDLTIEFNETQEGSGCNYQIIRMWTATDDCGNTGSTSQTIIIQDNEAPTITGVENDVTIDLSIEESIPNIPTNIVANDNCTSNPSLIFDENQIGETCSYQITRTWTATDDCENITIKTQTITVNNAITDISVTSTSDNCEMTTGTANITPTTYNYVWPNGLTGANQINLSADTYTITATNEVGCSSIFELIIEATCDCIEFDIEQEIYTNATCDENNGAATIIPQGDLTNYTYTWIPNLGTSNTVGNSHTDLPAGDYLVTIHFQGNPECEEKVEFTIDNDLSDCGSQVCEEEIIDEELITIEVFNANADVLACLPISASELNAYNVYLDNSLYSNTLEGCEEQFFVYYSYEILEDLMTNSSLEYSWDYPNGTINGTVTSIEELVLVMNSFTENQTWEHRSDEQTIVSVGNSEGYGNLSITHSDNDITNVLQANTFLSATGTKIRLPGIGTYNITLENPETACIDELVIIVSQNLTPPTSSDFLAMDEEVISYSCEEEKAFVCIDIAYSDFLNNYRLMNNGQLYDLETEGCNFISKHAYNFVTIPGYGNEGPYLMTWLFNGTNHSAQVDNLYGMLTYLNAWDTEENWSIDEPNYQFVGGVTNQENQEYENLIITQLTTGAVSNLALSNSFFTLSTQLSLSSGTNELVLINEVNNTQDELIIRAVCVTTDRIENTIFVGQEDEICLDTDELLGEVVSIENICESENFDVATLEEIDGTYCISCIGNTIGTDEACFVICDEYGICDTTYIQLTVLERNDEQEELIIYSGFSPNGDNINDAFTIDGLANYSKHNLIIFNRWGERVFSSKDYQNDWTGTFNNKMLPDGTYFYVLDLDDTETRSGYVHMNR